MAIIFKRLYFVFFAVFPTADGSVSPAHAPTASPTTTTTTTTATTTASYRSSTSAASFFSKLSC